MPQQRGPEVRAGFGFQPLELEDGEKVVLSAVGNVFALGKAINDQVKERCSGSDGKLNVSVEQYLELTRLAAVMMLENQKAKASPIAYIIGLRDILEKAAH